MAAICGDKRLDVVISQKRKKSLDTLASQGSEMIERKLRANPGFLARTLLHRYIRSLKL